MTIPHIETGSHLPFAAALAPRSVGSFQGRGSVPGHDLACYWTAMCHHDFTYSALHVWHLKLILKTINLTVLTNSKPIEMDRMGSFLSTSWIIQVRSNPLKHSSRIVRYINVCVSHLTKSWVILPHLNFFYIVCWEPARPPFHRALPEATFSYAQYWRRQSRGKDLSVKWAH